MGEEKSSGADIAERLKAVDCGDGKNPAAAVTDLQTKVSGEGEESYPWTRSEAGAVRAMPQTKPPTDVQTP